ncbi:hypothetical protein DFJ73DRAFT_765245 [Zopfochytrium polystomum]|nr:hypothetical protein DFJ73DRAFT_765245 [Zopfochytrium polystomum]
MSSWLNSLASSDGVSWVVKAVSEVESRIDRVLDIQPVAQQQQQQQQQPAQQHGAASSGAAAATTTTSPAIARSPSSAPAAKPKSPASLTPDVDSPAAPASSGFSAGLSSLRSISSSISSTLQATATSATKDVDFFSMLGGLSSSPLLSVNGPSPSSPPPSTRQRQPSVSPALPAASSPSLSKSSSKAPQLQPEPQSLPQPQPQSQPQPQLTPVQTPTQTPTPTPAPLAQSSHAHATAPASPIAPETHPPKPDPTPDLDLTPSPPVDRAPPPVAEPQKIHLPSPAQAISAEGSLQLKQTADEKAVDVAVANVSSTPPSADAVEKESTDAHAPESISPTPSPRPAANPPSASSPPVAPAKEPASKPVAPTEPPAPPPTTAANEPPHVLEPDTEHKAAETFASPPSSSSEELTRLKQVIEQRERQLLTAMTENASLTDTVNLFKTQLETIERTKSEELATLEALLAEARMKLADTESSLSTAAKDRDHARSQLNTLQGSLQLSAAQLTKQLQEREDKIKLLMDEGERMSMIELKLNTNLKKLRAKEAEAEKEQRELSRKLEFAASEIADLKERLTRITDLERKQSETIRSLNAANEQQAKQLVKLEKEAAAYVEELSQLKIQLERARQDLVDARRHQAEAASAATADVLEREIHANEELHRQLEELQRSSNEVETSLRREIFDLRSTLARTEEEYSWKEENLRKEINILHARLQAADERHEALFAEARTADRPLVRQIESLQNQHAMARRDWEQIEFSLTQKLQDAEAERNASVEHERALVAKHNELSNRLSVIELQFSREKQENARLAAELDIERQRNSTQERTVNDLSAKLDLLKSSHARAMEEAKENFQRTLRKQIQEERELWEEGQREERMRASKELERQKLRVDLSNRRLPSSPSLPRASSVATDSSAANSPTISLAPTPSSLAMAEVKRRKRKGERNGNFPEFLPSAALLSGTPAVVIDRLHMTVKQLQGQIGTLQTQLGLVTQTRDELADELLKSTTENTNLKAQAERAAATEKKLAELNTRYLTCLELLGEKTEQLDDMKHTLDGLRAAMAEMRAGPRVAAGAGGGGALK